MESYLTVIIALQHEPWSLVELDSTYLPTYLPTYHHGNLMLVVCREGTDSKQVKVEKMPTSPIENVKSFPCLYIDPRKNELLHLIMSQY